MGVKRLKEFQFLYGLCEHLGKTLYYSHRFYANFQFQIFLDYLPCPGNKQSVNYDRKETNRGIFRVSKAFSILLIKH